MFCPECGHRNPDDNRFCGMCGERLPERSRRTAENRPAPPLSTPEERVQSSDPEKRLEAPLSPGNPLYSSPAQREERRVESWRNQEVPRRAERFEPSTSSTSFLGLGNTEYEKPEREISWRFWALMLLLLGAAALFGMQWRAGKLRAEQQQQQQPKPAATETLPSSGDAQSNTPAKEGSALPSPTPEQSAPNKKGEPPVKEKDIPPPKGADANSKPDTSNDGDSTHTTDEEPPQSHQAKAETRAETPRESSDAPVQAADHLIQGGACNDAVRVLKDATGNPRAMTKLAAMYLTGTCVGPDRVMAYAWFSQAFSADPHNLRLENARRMVWSQMSEEERARVESGASSR